MKSTKITKSYVKCVRYYIIRRTLLHYQANVITLSEKKYYITRQHVYYIIRRCYYIIRQLLHYRAVLLHYQAVITLTGDYYIIGCNKARSPEHINTHSPALQKRYGLDRVSVAMLFNFY